MTQSLNSNKILTFISLSVVCILIIVFGIIILGTLENILDNSGPSGGFFGFPQGVFAFISSGILLLSSIALLGPWIGAGGSEWVVISSIFYLIVLPLFIWSIFYMIRKKLWINTSFKRISKFLGYIFAILCIFIIIRLLVPSIHNNNSIIIGTSDEKKCYHFFAIETGYDYICESNKKRYLKYDGDTSYEGKKGTYTLGFYGVRFREFE